MTSTASDRDLIRRIGQSIHLPSPSSERMTDRSSRVHGCSALLPAPLLTPTILDSLNPETSTGAGFVGYWPLRGPTAIRRLFSAHGAAGPSAMTSAAPPPI